MGTPIDHPTAGKPYAVCWGSGKPFGDIPTPNIIGVTFEGIEIDPSYLTFDADFINRRFLLQQQVGYSDRWRYFDGKVLIRWLLTAAESQLWIHGLDPNANIFVSYTVPCGISFVNINAIKWNTAGVFGTGLIDFDGF